MALCRDCSKPIPCHCHVALAVQVRPGVYLVEDRWPAHPDRREETPAQATATDKRKFDRDDHRDED